MNTFWTKEPLSEKQTELMAAILEAHRKSVFRDNISTVVLKATFDGSWSFQQSIASAILTFGGTHGPVESTMDIIRSPRPDFMAKMQLEMGNKVAGWGTSFQDDIWDDVGTMIVTNWPAMKDAIESVTKLLHDSGKIVHPNPSCWTAAFNIIVEIPRHLALWPVVQGRLPGWAEVLL
jgi:hypothetical protein